MTKKIITLAIIAMISCTTFALNASRAREEASYLTDKMAYRLGLTSYQWDDVYQINYDFFWTLDDMNRNYHQEITLRNNQLSYVLTPEQWTIYCTYDYFVTPAYVQNAVWVFPVYNHFKKTFFYGRSHSIMNTYKGGYRGNLQYYAKRHPDAKGHVSNRGINRNNRTSYGINNRSTNNQNMRGNNPGSTPKVQGNNNRTTVNNNHTTTTSSNNRPVVNNNRTTTTSSNNRPTINSNRTTTNNNNRSTASNSHTEKNNNNSTRTGGGGMKRH